MSWKLGFQRHNLTEENATTWPPLHLRRSRAVLWQAGFRNTTCATGTQLTPSQLAQLADQPGRSVYIVFDQDDNQAGQKASHQLALRLKGAGIRAYIVQLPPGHDPNRYFVAGAGVADFTARLQDAHRL